MFPNARTAVMNSSVTNVKKATHDVTQDSVYTRATIVTESDNVRSARTR